MYYKKKKEYMAHSSWESSLINSVKFRCESTKTQTKCETENRKGHQPLGCLMTDKIK